jgi:lysine/ornithine N-monooxygenase
MDDIVESMKLLYPEMFKAIRDFVLFEEKVKLSIDVTYGVGTLENIFKSHEYQTEIDNVKRGINGTSKLSRLAQRRKALFDRYTEETGRVAKVIGYKETLEVMDYLSKYFRRMASISG